MVRKRQTPSGAESSSPATEPVAGAVTLERLLGALPEQYDLIALRQALLHASTVDTTRIWARSSDYATYDKRVVEGASLRAIVAEAARTEHARIDALYARLARVLENAARGDDVAAGMDLIGIGEEAEVQEDPQTAATYYEVAARFGESLADRGVRILALRRLARTFATRGELERASSLYRAALEQAQATNNHEAQAGCLLALGNMQVLQGVWDKAAEHYQSALQLCGAEFPRMRAQIAINLATVHRERGELTESSDQLAAASALWSDLEPSTHSVWYANRGLLALERGDLTLAETTFRQALETAGSDNDRSMGLDNLAELYIRQGNLSEAEVYARAAEERALRAGSPRALADAYIRLGKIFRLRADLNGVTFFEKVLELCRGRPYQLTEANAYLEYGIFRRILGDTDEARSLLERAQELAHGIGAVPIASAAQDQLAQL